jgi:DUF971 family protein
MTLSPEERTALTRAVSLGNVAEPDPIVRELVPAVAELWDAYEDAVAKAAPLRAELAKATRARAAHRDDPAAVFSYPAGKLTFTDAKGVSLQNEVLRIEAASRAADVRAKRARVDYVVAAIEAAPTVRDVARERLADAHAAALEAAKALQVALADRERYWNAAGQPVGQGIEPDAATFHRGRYQAEHGNAMNALLGVALPKALALPTQALARELEGDGAK